MPPELLEGLYHEADAQNVEFDLTAEQERENERSKECLKW